jgi:putative heme-binding domain-containing protein
MGAARGPSELLIHILDPNRAVDAGYEVWNVETRDGKFQAGLITQENEARLLVRAPGNDVEVLKENIKTRTNTHRSLMPEGFEGLGAETLRDLVSYLCGGPSRFRVLDLSGAFTADTRRGLYESQEQLRDTVSFKKFGLVDVEGIPFDIASPEKSGLGGNLIVLKGGGTRSFANTLPARVEVTVGLPAKQLHFLGGIAGWGAREAIDGAPIMKVTMQFADKQSESVVLNNGVEFADYVAPIDIPGSKLAKGVVSERQIRWFTIPVRHGGLLEKVVLESFNSGPAPTTAAITAELAEK